MTGELERRARLHAALGDTARLAVVDELATSDRSSSELARLFSLPGNLLAHHLDVLERAGLVQRFTSAGDRRRRYVRLVREPLGELGVTVAVPDGLVLFVCTHNAARSQLAAALWKARTGHAATSAGTHPTEVHPEAKAAAGRAGLDLSDAVSRHVDDVVGAGTVVTVCDRAHEELRPAPQWWHWSVASPSEIGTAEAFDATVDELDTRIRALL